MDPEHAFGMAARYSWVRRVSALKRQASGNAIQAASNPVEAGTVGQTAQTLTATAPANTFLYLGVGIGVGGALLIPTISNRMGKLLYHLSQYSPFLRTFLAIRERPATLPAQIRLFGTPPGSSTSLIRQIGTHIVTGINVMFGGTPTWNEQDPVWWRNAVGLGIFVFVSKNL